MAIEVIAKIFEYDLPPREKYILILYANYSNRDGEGIWPSQTSIAELSGYSRKTINEVTKTLSTSGLLIADGVTKYGTKTWKINTDWVGTREDIEAVTMGLHPSVTMGSQPPVTMGSHNTSEDTSDNLSSAEEEFYPDNPNSSRNRTQATRKSKKEMQALAVGIGLVDPLNGYPVDVSDKLDVFGKYFPHVIAEAPNHIANWSKQVRAKDGWGSRSIKDIHAMCKYAKQEGWAVAQPASINKAYLSMQSAKQKTTVVDTLKEKRFG